MKKLLFTGILLSLIFGCKETNRIEIIPDYDSEYLSHSEVSTMAVPVDGPKPFPFESIIKKIHNDEHPDENLLYPVYFRIYISENGIVDKIKILDLDEKFEYRNEKYYSDTEKIIRKALPVLEKQKFNPAKLAGKNVKMRADVKLIYKVSGSVDVDITKIEQLSNKSDFDSPISDVFFVAVEQMPSPIGGIGAIQKNVVYPRKAKELGVQGKVFVKAFIDTLGNVVKTEIIRGIGAGCDEASLEAIKKIKFTPGYKDGKPVNTQVTVPIFFKLQ